MLAVKVNYQWIVAENQFSLGLALTRHVSEGVFDITRSLYHPYPLTQREMIQIVGPDRVQIIRDAEWGYTSKVDGIPILGWIEVYPDHIKLSGEMARFTIKPVKVLRVEDLAKFRGV